MNEEVVLSVENIKKNYTDKYRDVEVLKGVNLKLYKGEMLAIMGCSGSGKSTLLNILGALDSPDRGKLYVNGEEAKEYHIEPYASEYRSNNIGFIFQSFNLLKDLTIEENIALPLILKELGKKEIEERVSRIIKLVNLEKWKRHRILELSGGQQQRVAIARALTTNPPVILADEPTGNLDYNTTIEILDILKTMQDEFNQSIIMVTHDPKVASYADRVVFLHKGEIVKEHINKEKNIDNIILEFKNMLEA